MARIEITAWFFPDLIERMRSAGHEVHPRQTLEPIASRALGRAIASADAVISFLTDRIDGRAMDEAERLKVIANVAVGYENIDVEAALERRIHVTNTPDVLTESTADFTIALLLAAARHVAAADAELRRGSFPAWGLSQRFTGVELRGKTLGVLGMGRIGEAVARRAHSGFGMRIVYHNRSRRRDSEIALDAQFVSLPLLLAKSDILCIHVPLTDKTRHMIDAEALRRMKSEAILVNAARGAVVDEDALIAALQQGTIAGAALDVFEHEPLVPSALIDMTDRVVLAPHLGSATSEARYAMAELAVRNVLAVLEGRPPVSPVHVR